jgi:superkiller protein 3
VLLIAPLAGAGQLADDQNRQQAREHYREGEAHMQAEQWDKAEVEFKQAVQLDPLFTLAYYSLGQVYMATRTYPAAVDALQRCKDSFNQVAALGTTDRAAADLRLEQEIRDVRDAIVAYNAKPSKVDAAASSLRLETRLETLERQKRRGASGTEMPAEFSLALGSAYLRNGQMAEAEREYQAAIRVNPKMGEAHNNLAVVYMSTGRLPEAENAVKQAEKAGYKVNPQLKKDLASKKG